MEIDSPDNESVNWPEIPRISAVELFPVSVGGQGVGQPYAPADWPEPGDHWAWKVGGKTILASGSYKDRYLYPPKRFIDAGSRKKHGMTSQKAVKEFIRSRFPGADADAFLASFSWKIPSNDTAVFKVTDWDQYKVAEPPADQPRCKAGNVSCISLSVEHWGDSSHLIMSCDGCCAEPRFCRKCCCILCMKPVSFDHGGYSYVRCETMVDGAICGHLAHINCGLRCYLAGKVGGSIRLDAEYYCRFCDSNTDLVPHAEKLVQICDSLSTDREALEMVLKTGVSILRGSEKDSAKGLFQRFSSAYTMVRSGGNYKDLIGKEGSTSNQVIPAGPSDPEKGTSHVAMNVDPPVPSSELDHKAETIKVNGEIDQILQILNKGQEQDDDSQKEAIQSLHQQLDHERRILSSTDTQAVIEGIVRRVKQIKEQVLKLKDPKGV